MNKRTNRGSHTNAATLLAPKSVLIITMIIVMIIVAVFNNNSKTRTADASTVKEKYFTCISINEGDTLWSIADEYFTIESESYNNYIDEIKSINNLKGDKITSGMTLVIPIYK